MPTSGNNSFEGGTDGTLITAPASGGASGTAFDAIYGSAFFWKAAAALQGTMGAEVAASQFGAGQWTLSGTKVSGKMYFQPKAVPTADTFLMRVEKADGTRLFSVHANAAGKLRIDDAAGTTGTFTFAAVLDPTKYYRLEAYVVAGSTTSNGTIKVAYYIGNNTTPQETALAGTVGGVYTNTTANVGTAQTMGRIIEGKANNAPEAWWFDGIAFDTTLSDFIGVGTTTPPTVSTPPVQNQPISTPTSVSVTASSSSGTITGYAWSYLYPAGGTGAPALTGASTNTVSFTTPSTAGKLYQLQCVVTDSNGLTTTVQTEVRVPTSGDATVLPGSPTNIVGSWANVGGAATQGDALADSSASTYIESAALSATGQSERFRVQPMLLRGSLDIPVQFSIGSSGAVTAKARLYLGNTQLQEWSHTPVSTNPAVPDVFTDSVTSGNLALITDWGNLWYEPYGTSP